MILRRDRCQVLAVDLQERLVPAIADGETVAARAGILLAGGRLLGVPATISEHCADKIGPTRGDVIAAAGDAAAILPKRSFACHGSEPLRERMETLRLKGRDTLLVCGTEAHVCVLQSALAAAAQGLRVVLVADAIGSRRDPDRDIAIMRARDAGIAVATVEMALFEWLESADNPAFRDVLALIR